MPHCVLEFSDNILEKDESRKVLAQIHSALMKTELFTLADIKSRMIEHRNYLVGDGAAANAFVTLTVSILSGKTEETKKMISDLCLEVLKNFYSGSFKKLKMSITVQIKEIDKASYGKAVSY